MDIPFAYVIHLFIYKYILSRNPLVNAHICIIFQGPGPGTSTNQPPQPFFAPQGLPPGYPPPHFGHGSAMQPGVMGHVPPSAQQGR
jgi:hypothetical protein